MKRHLAGAATVLLSVASLPACTAAGPGTDAAPGPQPGVYESMQCESTRTAQGMQQHAKRRLEVGTAGSAWQFTLFADASCTVPLLRVRGRTEAAVLGPARHIPGAVAVQVRFLDRQAVALTPDTAMMLSQAGCGSGAWSVGVEQAIGQAACLGMPPIETCPFDFDVLRVEGDLLYTGQRSGDGTLCTADQQPTALDRAPLKRR